MGTQIANEHFLPFFSSSFSYLNNMAADSRAFRRMMDPRVVHSQSCVLVCSYLTKRSVGFLFSLPISSNEPETNCMCQVLAFLGRPRPSQMQRFIFSKNKKLGPNCSVFVSLRRPSISVGLFLHFITCVVVGDALGHCCLIDERLSFWNSFYLF